MIGVMLALSVRDDAPVDELRAALLAEADNQAVAQCIRFYQERFWSQKMDVPPDFDEDDWCDRAVERNYIRLIADCLADDALALMNYMKKTPMQESVRRLSHHRLSNLHFYEMQGTVYIG